MEITKDMTDKNCYKLTLTASGEKIAELPGIKRAVCSILDGCRNNGYRLTYGEHGPHEESLKGRAMVTTCINITCKKEELPEDVQTQLKQYGSLAPV